MLTGERRTTSFSLRYLKALLICQSGVYFVSVLPMLAASRLVPSFSNTYTFVAILMGLPEVTILDRRNLDCLIFDSVSNRKSLRIRSLINVCSLTGDSGDNDD